MHPFLPGCMGLCSGGSWWSAGRAHPEPRRTQSARPACACPGEQRPTRGAAGREQQLTGGASILNICPRFRLSPVARACSYLVRAVAVRVHAASPSERTVRLGALRMSFLLLVRPGLPPSLCFSQLLAQTLARSQYSLFLIT